MAVVVDIDHEAGNLTEYSYTATGGGDLSVAAGAALAGTSYGLQLVINDTTAIYGQRGSIGGTTGRARVRFYIDPNSMTMANTNEFKLLLMYNASTAVFARVSLVYADGVGYEIRGGIANDAGTFTSTSDYAITDAPHYIEMDVIAASAAGANDGSLQLWIDGAAKQTLTGIDNDTRAASFGILDFGAAANLDAGTTGTFYLDELKANDDGSAIGPLSNAYSLPAEAAAFTLTGNDAGFGRTYVLGAEPGAFTLTGIDAGMVFGAYGAGGTPLGLLLLLTNPSYQEHRLIAGTGSFTLTGISNNLIAALILPAEAAAFTETGNDAGLYAGYRLTAETGAFALTGQDANFAFTGLTHYSITAGLGAFNLTGQAAGLIAARKLAADYAVFALGGNAATLARGLYLGAGAGSYSLTGISAGLLAGWRVMASAGSFALTGVDAGFLYQPAGAYTLFADPGAFAVTGIDAGLLVALILTADPGEYVWTGQAATFVTGTAAQTPAARIYVIGAETRILIIPAESRVFSVRE